MKTFEVTFLNVDGSRHLTTRVETDDGYAAEAIDAAGERLAEGLTPDLTWEVRIRTVDTEAEESHAAAYAPLYVERDDAIAIFENAGFNKVVGTEWYKHDASGLLAGIDEPEGAIGQRYASIYRRGVDPETGKDFVYALVMIPWYGDGAWHEVALTMLSASIAMVIATVTVT